MRATGLYGEHAPELVLGRLAWRVTAGQDEAAAEGVAGAPGQDAAAGGGGGLDLLAARRRSDRQDARGDHGWVLGCVEFVGFLDSLGS
jgi:hypothetical protein